MQVTPHFAKICFKYTKNTSWEWSFELEGGINSRDCSFKFLNRSIPIYAEKEIVLKPNEQKVVKVKAPFVDEISGMAIIKILDGGTYSMLLIKLKFTGNKAILDVVN